MLLSSNMISLTHKIPDRLPFVVAAPRGFSGAPTFGALMQTASAFGFVRESLSWFINVYTSFVEWKATVDRLIGFHQAIEAVQRAQQQNPGIELASRPKGSLKCEIHTTDVRSIGTGPAHWRDAGFGHELGYCRDSRVLLVGTPRALC
jgi:ABC-type uncharacterized transport system fused permease/ATPase subunit